MGYKIHPISVGNMMIDKSINTYMQNIGETIKQEIYMWLIEGRNRLIIVDTGPPSLEHCKLYQREISQTFEQVPINALQARGVDPERIDTVIMTHLHWDHCGNNSLFPNAEFIVQKSELEYAVNPLPVHCRGYESPTWGRVPKPLWIGSKYKAIDRDYELLPGIRLLYTPGHSPGSQAVLVDGEESGVIAIAGDTFPLYENFTSMENLIPSAIHVNLYDYYPSMERLMKAADVILPGHDPKVLDQRFYT